MSRRRVLGMAGAAGLSAALSGASCGRPEAASTPGNVAPSGEPAGSSIRTPRVTRKGALGANFNGAVGNVNFDELDTASAGWLRGFCLASKRGEPDPRASKTIRTMQEAGQLGFGTILSLKYQFLGTSLPTPGSAEMKAELDRLDEMLPMVMGKVDKLVIGNEPFRETSVEERTPKVLNPFYETIAHHVLAHRQEHGGDDCPTQLYMGALNQLDEPGERTESTRRWLRFVHDTNGLAGVDIHPHVRTPEATDAYLEHVVPELADGQEFLVTEFSLVWLWQDHLRDPVVGKFGGRRGDRTEVWQVIRRATEERFTQQDWNDFLSAQPWFERHKHFLRDQLGRFRRTERFGVATYGFWQDEPMATDFTATSVPWLLNSVFAPCTVQPRPDGTSGRGYHWIEDFRALQQY